MNSSIVLAREWLRKASYDLRSAKILHASPDKLYETAIYHCQQAAEKAIKAVLVAHRQHVPLTHDIALLLERAGKFDKGLAQFEALAESITGYATEYRYPNTAADELSISEVQSAIEYASELVEYIASLISNMTD
jgi:HEPN domain-containing protein